MAIRRIVDLELIRLPLDRHIELAFAGIDTGANHAMLAHLPRPFLVMRTQGSFNHPGPMKCRPRSCYDRQPATAAMDCDPTIGGRAWVATWARPFPTERTQFNTLR